MKKLFVPLVCFCGILLAAGCGKPPEKMAPPVWEYKVVVVENFAHEMEKNAEHEMSTNTSSGLDNLRYYKSDPGSFDFEASLYSSESLISMGGAGWELVSAVPQIETIPDAEYLAGHTYIPSTSTLNPDYLPFANTRTGKVILLFKRPK